MNLRSRWVVSAVADLRMRSHGRSSGIWLSRAHLDPDVTICAPAQHTDGELMEIIRAHWSATKNGMHGCRDVSPAEDACGDMDPLVPIVLAALRLGCSGEVGGLWHVGFGLENIPVSTAFPIPCPYAAKSAGVADIGRILRLPPPEPTGMDGRFEGARSASPPLPTCGVSDSQSSPHLEMSPGSRIKMRPLKWLEQHLACRQLKGPATMPGGEAVV